MLGQSTGKPFGQCPLFGYRQGDRSGTKFGVREKMLWVVLGRCDEANRTHATGLQEGQQLRNRVDLIPAMQKKVLQTCLTAKQMATEKGIFPQPMALGQTFEQSANDRHHRRSPTPETVRPDPDVLH